jgi:hypothetical protein
VPTQRRAALRHALPRRKNELKKAIPTIRSGLLYPTLSVLAASLLAACGGGGHGAGPAAFLPPPATQASSTTFSGVLTASAV